MELTEWGPLVVTAANYVTVPAFIVALIRWRSLSYPVQYYLGWYAIFVFSTAALQLVAVVKWGMNTMFLSHFIPMAEAGLFLAIFSQYISRQSLRFLFGFVIVASLIGSVFIYPLTQRNLLAQVAHYLVSVGISVYFLATEMQQDAYRGWWRRPIVLIALANLAYYTCAIVYYVPFNWLVDINYMTTLRKLSVIHAIFSILHSLLLTIAIWIRPSPLPNQKFSDLL